MFISVDLPAPFSPSSACTSPRPRSKSTWSFASDPGEPLRDPAQLEHGRAGAASMRRRDSEARSGSRGRSGRLQRGGRLDLPSMICCFSAFISSIDLLRHLRLILPRATPSFARLKIASSPPLNVAVLDRLDRVEDRVVDALDRAGQDVRAEVGLVAVDADAPDALLLGRRRARRGRSRRPPGRRPASPARSGRARSPCTCPGRRSPASSPSGP